MAQDRSTALCHYLPWGLAILLFSSAVASGADAAAAGGAAAGGAAADGATAGKPAPWPGYWSHLTALFLIGVSFVTTAALNAAKPDTRLFGTVLASLGCFGICGFYFWALAQGVIANPRPIYTPTDHLKPGVMTGIGGLAALAGVFLLQVARWQGRAQKQAHDREKTQNGEADRLLLPVRNTPEKYGRVSRYLHWMIAILFLAMIPMGIFMSMIPSGTPYRYGFYGLHKTIGITVLILVLARLFWNFRSQRPAADESLSNWERRLARGAHTLLYVMMLGFPLTGYIMSTLAGRPTSFFLWELPMLLPENSDAATPFGFLHKIILPYLFYIIAGAHILGVLKHQFIDRKNTIVRRMVS